MASHKQNAKKVAILERRRNVARRYLRGETQWEIARAFEINQSTISEDLAAVRAEWLAEAVQDMDAIKSRELAKIDEVERSAWVAWTRSQENGVVVKSRTKNAQGEIESIEKSVKGQAGDPRFLDLLLKCVTKRCEILGVDMNAGAASVPIQVLRGIDENAALGNDQAIPVS